MGEGPGPVEIIFIPYFGLLHLNLIRPDLWGQHYNFFLMKASASFRRIIGGKY